MAEISRPLPPEITLSYDTDLLKGKTAILTGGSTGIGRSIGVKLAAHGVNVAFNSTQKSEAQARGLEESVNGREGWGTVVWEEGDITESSTQERLLARAVDQFGRLDILVNCAGITADNLMHKLTEEDIMSVFKVKAFAAFSMTQMAVDRFLYQRTVLKDKNGGVVVNITSTSARGQGGQANYAAANAALEAWGNSSAEEYGSRGIRFVNIRPGLVPNTGITKKGGDKLEAGFKERSKLKRTVEGEDIAETVIYVVSDRGKNITGETLTVSAGF